MANWCENRVTISGSSEAIAYFKKKCMPDGKFKLNNIIPEPTDLGDGDLSTWRYDHWGVNREIVCVDFLEDSEDCIVMSFDSAWGPPEGICAHIRDNYKVNVSWFYGEPGMEIAGYL